MLLNVQYTLQWHTQTDFMHKVNLPDNYLCSNLFRHNCTCLPTLLAQNMTNVHKQGRKKKQRKCNTNRGTLKEYFVDLKKKIIDIKLYYPMFVLFNHIKVYLNLQ